MQNPHIETYKSYADLLKQALDIYKDLAEKHPEQLSLHTQVIDKILKTVVVAHCINEEISSNMHGTLPPLDRLGEPPFMTRVKLLWNFIKGE